MRIIELSNKTYLIRHWLKWYLVERGAKKWTPLDTNELSASPTVAKGKKAIPREYPMILNEKAAETEISKKLKI